MQSTRIGLDSRGFTLLELLIALAIFGVVMSMAYGVIVNGIVTHANQEATVGAQAKLRRIVEVIGQDVRSAVFGSIIDSPYTSNSEDVSFLLLTGGAGYALDSYTMGSSQVDIVSSAVGVATGDQVVIVNQQGQGVLTRVTAVTSSSGKKRLSLSCAIHVPHTTNTLLFEVNALGLHYDSNTRDVRIRFGTVASDAPFAFDINEFRIDYVYTAAGEEPIISAGPHRTGGSPDRTFNVGDVLYTLSRLQFVVGTESTSRNGVRQHSYAAQIDLLSSQDFTVRELATCS